MWYVNPDARCDNANSHYQTGHVFHNDCVGFFIGKEGHARCPISGCGQNITIASCTRLTLICEEDDVDAAIRSSVTQ